MNWNLDLSEHFSSTVPLCLIKSMSIFDRLFQSWFGTVWIPFYFRHQVLNFRYLWFSGRMTSMNCRPISLVKTLQMVRRAAVEGASDSRAQTNRVFGGAMGWGVCERSQEGSWLREGECWLIILYLTPFCSYKNKMCFCLETSLFYSSASRICAGIN